MVGLIACQTGTGAQNPVCPNWIIELSVRTELREHNDLR